jgi:hypothetical protein
VMPKTNGDESKSCSLLTNRGGCVLASSHVSLALPYRYQEPLTWIIHDFAGKIVNYPG